MPNIFVTFVLIFVKTLEMRILHLRHNDIDFDRWDNTMNLCANRLCYAYSWFLNIVSPNWEALVSEDFNFLMPLPVKRKYKIPYIVQPLLAQQLGVFSAIEIDDEVLQLFIKSIPYYSYEINLNENNKHEEVICRKNYILKLNNSYLILKTQFSKNTIRNIEKAKKLKINIEQNVSIDEYLNLYYSVEKQFKSSDKNVLQQLLTEGINRNQVTIYGAYDNDKQLIAAVCIFLTEQRLTYLFPVSSTEGKQSSAMFLIINQLVKEYAEKNILLDFEGSQIEGIARFYKGFGAVNQPYYVLKKFRPSFLVGKI